MGWRTGLTKTWLLGHLERHCAWWLCDCSATYTGSFHFASQCWATNQRNVILELTKWQIKPSVSSMVAFHGHSHFHKHWACTEQMLVLKMNFYHVRECLHCGFPDNHSIACCLYSQIHANILVSMWYCLTSVPNKLLRTLKYIMRMQF